MYSCKIEKSKELPFIETTLNYVKEAEPGKLLGMNMDDSEDDQEKYCNDVVKVLPVKIYDARGLRPEASLPSTGFQLIRHPTKIKDFQNPDNLKLYYAEI